MIEYARNLRQPIRALLRSADNAGTAILPFTYALLQGEGHAALEAIIRLVDGRKDNILLGHSTENWTKYETRVFENLHISRIR